MKITFRLILFLVLTVTLVVGAYSALHLWPIKNPSAQELEKMTAALWNDAMPLFILSAILIAVAALVVHWNMIVPSVRIAEWLKKLRMGEINEPLTLPRGNVLEPLAAEVAQIVKSLAAARAAAEKEARLRLSSESIWTAEKLKEHVRFQLGNKTLFVVSNREPYMHIKNKRKTECIVPPSGLVTALDPVMRACEGVWIAHGSGEADLEVCDGENKVRVPPDEPAYTLKRVWLTKEEINGHYNGFSNEGLWPLCHITHTRPIFRLEDWVYYQKVNEKFAESILKEIKKEETPLVLIQDYHFALLPLMIREKRPDARIAIFWHIPWPNPESFGICPWKQEILQGMLGADLIGFHIQFHCNNFLDTVDNNLESKLNWEQFSIERGGRTTLIKPFPISVDFRLETARHAGENLQDGKWAILEKIRNELGIHSKHLAMGVDRLDYTKGIIERFRAIERFLEKYPRYVGEFTFVELGAPSRTNIQKYNDFIVDVEKTAEAINQRFQKNGWKPIVLLKAQHSHAEILPFYKAADLCMVTSLHDGMNLVAKEFVSSRTDQDGILILSEFTGASRELRDALLVNPYDIEAMAEAIRTAVEMKMEERIERMRRMREVIRERNIYRWAGNLISALCKLRTQESSAPLLIA